jgi:alkanesulfonate monooxygenase SsuD/methylene tetrahydromethanopterin reductase-like flavin-dependent oxidoreductase (luciferase family)
LSQFDSRPNKVSFAGGFFSFSDMHVSPKPVQQPHPPIWIGGASDAALRLAARFAALWQRHCQLNVR